MIYSRFLIPGSKLRSHLNTEYSVNLPYFTRYFFENEAIIALRFDRNEIGKGLNHQFLFIY